MARDLNWSQPGRRLDIMDKITLGRTGLEVSVAGLGSGGHSRIGQSTGRDRAASVAIVHAALDHGITLVDTAPVYGTEEIVADGIAGKRDQIVLSTKSQVTAPGTSVLGESFKSGEELKRDVEASLKRLKTERIDILHLHGVMPNQYAYCRQELVPALLDLRQAGKIGFLGLTERFIYDPRHDMLALAVEDEFWDVIMIGCNLINASARGKLLPRMAERGVGTLCMFAVRSALSNPDAMLELFAQLIADGLVDRTQIDPDNPLDFLVDDSDAENIVEAAYRFCRHLDGMDVVLTGTGSEKHLLENIAAINRGPLPPGLLDKIERLFGHIDTVSGN